MKRMATASVVLLTAAGIVSEITLRARAPQQTRSDTKIEIPTFKVDPAWPRVPAKWVLGLVSGVSVDSQDHIWVLHRPRTVKPEDMQRAAPPVLEFDVDGKFIQGWGGPGAGYEWPDTEHGIAFDDRDNVWIAGSSAKDGQLLKFTKAGKFLLQIGRSGQSKGNTDTQNVRGAADITYYKKTNEIFVADGYNNRRIIVFDADTGAFKRMWGAFGNVPTDPPPPPPGGRGNGLPPPDTSTEGRGADQFNLVHSARISNDGLLYVADRANKRVQIFTPEGKYVDQVFISRTTPPSSAEGTAFGRPVKELHDGLIKAGMTASRTAFSPDKEQRFLYVIDRIRQQIAILDRKSLTVLGYVGDGIGSSPGAFYILHDVTADSKGNLYTAEVNNDGNRRAQKFTFTGMSTRRTDRGSPQAQSAPRGEWPAYAADLASTRYSPLDQINAGNFEKLEVAWRFKTDNLGPRPEFQYEGTPLMVNGVLYATGGSRRAVFALDPETGELKWVHSVTEGPRATNSPRQLSGRGLSYWSDGKEERIYYVTVGYQLVALDAKTGARIPSFGKNGMIDLKLENDQTIDPLGGDIGLHATPLVTRNVIVIGAAFGTGANPKSPKAVKGNIRGYDVRTGKRLWIFHTIPTPGEFGNDTWKEDSWSYTGNTGVWAQMSADEELGLAYLPIESPTGDYFGANRPGDNLFGESLVAVDLQTGKRKWHYQFVHHPIWDMDLPCAPILVDIPMNGRMIKAIAQPSKQSFLYVLNRETGQPIWPIEERPVEKGNVPGEYYSPTQPFPTKPPAYERQSVTIDDLIDFTPEMRAEAVELVKKYTMGSLFNPPVVSKIDGPIAALTRSQAGTNWKGGSYDPETHVVYVSSTGNIGSYGLVPPPAGFSEMQYIAGNAITGARLTAGAGSAAGGGNANLAQQRGAAAAGSGAGAAPAGAGEGAGGGGGGRLSVRGLPIGKPPYGSLTAIDLKTGDILWKAPHGDTPSNIKNNPALKGLNIPNTGRPGTVGTLVTKTLLIAGDAGVDVQANGQRGAMLRAYDKATGARVGAVFMPAGEGGAPMTYMVNGKQYIVIAISSPGYSGELLAFRLPS